MNICYYPGCTLSTTAKELDISARKSAQKLGIIMEEIPDWQCCGGVYPNVPDEIATRLASIRALDYAKHHGGVLLTLCSACYNVLKRVNADMASKGEVHKKANAYLKLDEPYNGETKVIHYLELLRDYVGFDKLKQSVVNPVNRKVSAYYGCLLLRPGKVMNFDSPENPTIMENFISAIGGEVIKSPMRNECCGAYVGTKDKDLALKRSRVITDSAINEGAEEIITACPLCLYNLKKGGGNIEVTYFTTLLAYALGVE